MPHLRRHAHLHAGQQLICNQLDKQLPAQARRLMFNLAPAKWFAAWRIICNIKAGFMHAIGLQFMKQKIKQKAYNTINQLEKQLPAQARRLMFSFAPAKWFAAWHVTRRRAVGMIRAIGLEFMERIRKSEGG